MILGSYYLTTVRENDEGAGKVLSLIHSSVGRIIFNTPVPQNLGYIDRTDPEHWLEYEVSFRAVSYTHLPGSAAIR